MAKAAQYELLLHMRRKVVVGSRFRKRSLWGWLERDCGEAQSQYAGIPRARQNYHTSPPANPQQLILRPQMRSVPPRLRLFGNWFVSMDERAYHRPLGNEKVI